jgi:hypothetical protein
MSHNLNSHPTAGMTLSITFLSTGTAMHYADLSTVINSIHIPDVCMQVTQISFWALGALFAYRTSKKK